MITGKKKDRFALDRHKHFVQDFSYLNCLPRSGFLKSNVSTPLPPPNIRNGAILIPGISRDMSTHRCETASQKTAEINKIRPLHGRALFSELLILVAKQKDGCMI